MKQMSLFKLFIAAGVAVWAIPYAFTALSNVLIPLLVVGAVPDTHYTISPYTMFAACGSGLAGILTLTLGWMASIKRHKTETATLSNVTVKNVTIASSSSTGIRAKRRLSRQQA